MITDSAHLGLVTVCLLESNQANSMQDVDDTGSAFGTTRMNFETLDSKIATGLMKIITSEFERKIQVAVALQGMKGLVMLTGRQIAHR